MINNIKSIKSIKSINIKNSLFTQKHNFCKNCNRLCISEYGEKYCFTCYTKDLFEVHEEEDFPKEPLKLQRELSLPYAFPDDICNINVPLKVRLKYDRVIKEINKI